MPFSGSGKAIGLVAFNTHIAACAGATSALFASWRLNGKSDIGLTINGALGALVSVTAGCAFVTPLSAVIIGAVGGVFVVLLVLWIERLGLDDPVGAISVHAGCGTWGTLAVAFFHHDGFRFAQLATQVLGAVACFVWAFGMAWLVLRILRATTGLRVSFDAEVDGLDWSEHAGEGYPPDFATAVAVKRQETGDYANAQ
jgi:Amt family ammonium transporter